MKTIKKPRNDEDLKRLLKSLGRTDEQIDGIMDFGRFSKAIIDEPEENFIETVNKMKQKWHSPDD